MTKTTRLPRGHLFFPARHSLLRHTDPFRALQGISSDLELLPCPDLLILKLTNLLTHWWLTNDVRGSQRSSPQVKSLFDHPYILFPSDRVGNYNRSGL
ncbi:hypothetical protein NPIL_246961 [Nephila pilipes]|uniref:Uncharacterized protein n=1 Tax=Nephila pilipes TaxID=299642 RepID=A0A8X6QDJ1_NEPPI|nr:hypothetical protein NPIL_246961 [Nephila pilipes]